MCIPTSNHRPTVTALPVSNTSALEFGTGLELHEVRQASDCFLCGAQLSSEAQRAGADVCGDCTNGPRAA